MSGILLNVYLYCTFVKKIDWKSLFNQDYIDLLVAIIMLCISIKQLIIKEN